MVVKDKNNLSNAGRLSSPTLSSTSHEMPIKTTILWLCTTSIFFYFLFATMGTFKSRPANSAANDMPTTRLPDPSEDIHECGDFYIEGDNKQWRVQFGDNPGASVRGWPSKGGLYTLYPCFTVELDFLGLDHFKEADRAQNSSTAEADEEAHCKRMRQLGAKWWPSADEEAMWWLMNPKDNWPLKTPATYFGWPAQGGVWVLNTTIGRGAEMGAGRIHIAITMEERCKIMEDLGAVYYAKPEDCPLLDLSDEAVPST
jgi:hypothetical protein